MFSYSDAMRARIEPVGATLNAGEAVRQLRVARDVSARRLAERVGVSPATISAIENGKTGISVQRLQQIAVALGVPAASLIDDLKTSPPPRSLAPSLSVRPAGSWREFGPLPID